MAEDEPRLGDVVEQLLLVLGRLREERADVGDRRGVHVARVLVQRPAPAARPARPRPRRRASPGTRRSPPARPGCRARRPGARSSARRCRGSRSRARACAAAPASPPAQGRTACSRRRGSSGRRPAPARRRRRPRARAGCRARRRAGRSPGVYSIGAVTCSASRERSPLRSVPAQVRGHGAAPRSSWPDPCPLRRDDAREHADAGEQHAGRERLAEHERARAARVSSGWASWTWPTRATPPRARPAYQAKKPRNIEIAAT